EAGQEEAAGAPVQEQPAEAESAAGDPSVPADPGLPVRPDSAPATPVNSDVRREQPPSPQPAATATPAPDLLVDNDQGGAERPPSGSGLGRAEEGPAGAAERLSSERTRRAGGRTWIWVAAAAVSVLTVLGAGAALLAFRLDPEQSFLARVGPVVQMAKALGQRTDQLVSALTKGSAGRMPSVSSEGEGEGEGEGAGAGLRPASRDLPSKGKGETVAGLPPGRGTPKTTAGGAGDARSASEAQTLLGNTGRPTPLPAPLPAHPAHQQPHELGPNLSAAEGAHQVSAGGAGSALRTQVKTESGNETRESGTTAGDRLGTAAKAAPAKTSEPVPERSDLATLAGKLRSLGLAPERDGKDVLKVNLVKGLRFDSESAEVPADSRPFVQGIAEALAGNPGLAVKVVGHTDPYGNKAYNDWLSLQRAKAVAAVLVAEGVPADEIATEGLGSREPLPGTAQRGRPRPSVDRRVELIIHLPAAR
ncbi:MAG: OmpA family protein, partial [Chromatiaceae bacterium]